MKMNSTSYVNLPSGYMIQPQVGGFENSACPCIVFLIKHPSGRTLVFDLGVRKDWGNAAPVIVKMIKEAGFDVGSEKDVATILTEGGVPLTSVEGIVWSHYHFDHTGDPSRFPASTALIVGPGFKGRFEKAYPSDPESLLTEDAWEGRELREIGFEGEGSLKIGRFNAFDYFGDGSFYLLDTPGHLLGHMCGLARTTADTYIFMGGDAAHHAGEIRPTEYIPLPHTVTLSPHPSSFPHACPGEILQMHIHPEQSATKPFYHAREGFNEDEKVADWSIDGLTEFDADERVFVVIAHDASLTDVIDFYPAKANRWFEKGWGKDGHWQFLADFSVGLEELKKAGKF
jgi:glyoxylase-like metal-dependent hydrolase (beta-lactamase superfamily II)